MRLFPIPLLAIGLALSSTPAPAQEQNAYQAGVAARLAGRPADARQLLGAWLAEHPADVDARLQLALADLALGDLDAAERGFREVLAQAPDYADAHDGLAAVTARRTAAREVPRGTFVLEGAVSDLAGPAENWRELAVDVELPASPQAAIGGRAAYYRRFGLEDVEFIGRVTLHPSDDLWLRAHIGGTPDADFRPEIALGGGLDLRVSRAAATVLSFDAAYQRFPTQDVVTFNPGVVQYLPGGQAWITVRGIGTVADGGPLQVGGLVRADFMPARDWRVFGGASNGPDTDLGVVTRVTSLFGGVEAPLGRGLSLTGSLAREWREAAADRTELRLGLKARF